MMTNTRLLSIRLITDDVARLVEFYELVTGLPAEWSTPDFAEIVTPVGALAIGSTRTVALFGEGTARAAANHSAIIEFIVDDVDAEYARLGGERAVTGPATLPWGNRSLLLRDPDGNLVNLFTPVTPDAVTRFDPWPRRSAFSGSLVVRCGEGSGQDVVDGDVGELGDESIGDHPVQGGQ